jgi:hypothetical protein
MLPSRTLKCIINVSGTLNDADNMVSTVQRDNKRATLSHLDDDYIGTDPHKIRTLSIATYDSSKSCDQNTAVLEGLKPGGNIDVAVVLRKGDRGVFDANVKSSIFAESLPKQVSTLLLRVLKHTVLNDELRPFAQYIYDNAYLDWLHVRDRILCTNAAL